MIKNLLKNLTLPSIPYLMLSIIAAIVLWGFVMSEIQPIKKDQVRPLITIQNLENWRTQGKSFEISDNTTRANVTFYVKEDKISQIQMSDFNVYIDANEYDFNTDTAKVYCKVSDTIKNYITNVNWEPKEVHVTTNALTTKEFEIKYNTVGQIEHDKAIGYISIDKTKVSIEGVSDELNKISSVEIKIDVSQKIDDNAEIRGKENLILYDADNNILDTNNLTMNVDEVAYTVKIYDTKKVKFNALVRGHVAAGYEQTGVFISPSHIEITGPRNILAKLDSIDIPGINITNLTKNKEYKFNIANVLPSGIQAIDTDEKVVSVTIGVDKDENYVANNTDQTPVDTAATQLTPDSYKIYEPDKGKSAIIIAPKATKSEFE